MEASRNPKIEQTPFARENGRAAESGTLDHARRAALLRLGLGAGIAYVAPSILQIERRAFAHSSESGGSGGSGGCGRRWWRRRCRGGDHDDWGGDSGEDGGWDGDGDDGGDGGGDGGGDS